MGARVQYTDGSDYLAATVSWCFFGVRVIGADSLKSMREMKSALVLRCLLLGLLNPAFIIGFCLQPMTCYRRRTRWPLTTPGDLLCHSLPPCFRAHAHKYETGLALLSYLGILVIATNGNLGSLEFDQPAGVALALFSTVIWGLSWVVNSRIVDANNIDPELALFLNFSAALPVLWIVTGLTGQLPSVSMGSLLGGLYVGLFEMGIAFVLWMNAMRLTDNPLRISSLIFLAPPLSLLLIGTVLNETIAGSTLVGLVIILVGLAGQQWLDRAR